MKGMGEGNCENGSALEVPASMPDSDPTQSLPLRPSVRPSI